MADILPRSKPLPLHTGPVGPGIAVANNVVVVRGRNKKKSIAAAAAAHFHPSLRAERWPQKPQIGLLSIQSFFVLPSPSHRAQSRTEHRENASTEKNKKPQKASIGKPLIFP